MGIKVMRENENLLKREFVLPKTSVYLKKFNNQKAKNGTSFKESIKLLRASINFAIKKMQTHLPYINQEPISNSQKPLLSIVFLDVPQFNRTKTEHQLYFAKSIYFN